jgi:putative toxin-antitoxin system antitoxin component (TIGR02293 family)
MSQAMKKASDTVQTMEKEFGLYLQKISGKDGQRVVRKKITVEQFFSNRMLMVHAIRQGIPLSLFDSIQESAPFTDQDWSTFLDISLKSLQRYRQDRKHVFKASHSEKILELTEVSAKGKAVFGSNEKFYAWLNDKNFALGNMKPAELLRDSYGKELVLSELNRIDQGIFA